MGIKSLKFAGILFLIPGVLFLIPAGGFAQQDPTSDWQKGDGDAEKATENTGTDNKPPDTGAESTPAVMTPAVSTKEDSTKEVLATKTPPVDPAEFEKLKAEFADLKEQVDADRAAAEEEADQKALEDAEFKPSLDVYGFMALYAGKWFVDEDNPLYGVFNNKISFGVTDINLYFSGHLTESLSTLVELRFTFIPHGTDQFPEMTRINSTVVDPISSEELTMGGVIIERALFTWQPKDVIGVTAGRYLTPFGIWNEDHGAPVLIPVHQPYLIMRNIIPEAQTGLFLHGRFFPSGSSKIDYALTLSNGRGPAEAVYDLDNNKALGFRLKYSYEKGQDFEFSLGGYGMMGTGKDEVKFLNLDSLGIARSTTEKYSETSGSVDLLLRLWGFRIQSEAAAGLIKYEVRPEITIPIIEAPSAGQYQSDHIRWDVYALLAYEFVFNTKYGDMRLTPFAMMEWDTMYDDSPQYDTALMRYGLNYKPHYRFTTKVDFTIANFPDNEIVSRVWAINTQAAVTF